LKLRLTLFGLMLPALPGAAQPFILPLQQRPTQPPGPQPSPVPVAPRNRTLHLRRRHSRLNRRIPHRHLAKGTGGTRRINPSSDVRHAALSP